MHTLAVLPGVEMGGLAATRVDVDARVRLVLIRGAVATGNLVVIQERGCVHTPAVIPGAVAVTGGLAVARKAAAVRLELIPGAVAKGNLAAM